MQHCLIPRLTWERRKNLGMRLMHATLSHSQADMGEEKEPRMRLMHATLSHSQADMGEEKEPGNEVDACNIVSFPG